MFRTGYWTAPKKDCGMPDLRGWDSGLLHVYRDSGTSAVCVPLTAKAADSRRADTRTAASSPGRNKAAVMKEPHLVTKSTHPRAKRVLRNLERVIPGTAVPDCKSTKDYRTTTYLFPTHDPHVLGGSCASSWRADGALLVLARALFFWLMPGYARFENSYYLAERVAGRRRRGSGQEAEERDRVCRRSSRSSDGEVRERCAARMGVVGLTMTVVRKWEAYALGDQAHPAVQDHALISAVPLLIWSGLFFYFAEGGRCE